MEPIPFSGNPLDRMSGRRRDTAWIEGQIAAPASRFLPFWRLNALVTQTEMPGLHWLDASVFTHLNGSGPVLLGVREETAHFAVDLSHLEEPLTSLALADVRFGDVRSLATELAFEEAGIVAHGRAAIDFHRRHAFCGACGAPTLMREGGSARKCSRCSAEIFPRTDPVVIMVVWRGERCLLGSRPGRGSNYSCLAGFIDQGETIEEAVRREVMEEVGVPVDEVTYVASQPWPFPSTLMIGCFAHAASDEFNIDPVEIESARWFSRDELRLAVAGAPEAGFTVPNRVAIAHHLLKAWSELA